MAQKFTTVAVSFTKADMALLATLRAGLFHEHGNMTNTAILRWAMRRAAESEIANDKAKRVRK